MGAIITLLLLFYVTLVINRVATAILVRTGLSREVARFQAWSAITGCGFTTSESEEIVRYPVRRRVIRILMLFGNFGIVAAIASSILGFINHDFNHWYKLAMIAAGLLLLWVAAGSRWLDNLSARYLDRLLRNHAALGFSNYSNLYHLPRGYRVSSIAIDRNSPWLHQTIASCGFEAAGIVLLGIHSRHCAYEATPPGSRELKSGDVLTLYARQSDIQHLLAAATTPKPAEKSAPESDPEESEQ